MMAAQRILVIRMHGVGDVLWATPFLANLRRGYPDARIALLVRDNCAPVLENNVDIDELVVFRKGSLAQAISFLFDLRRRRFDLVIDLIGTPRTAIQSLATGARRRIGFDFRIRRLFYTDVLPAAIANRGHEVEFNFFVLQHLGVPVVTRALVFRLSEPERDFQRQIWRQLRIAPGQPVLGVLPTGGWACKRWPVDHYIELIAHFRSRHPEPVLVFWGSTQEYGDAKRIAAACGGGVDPAPPTTLRQMAALLAACALAVGNDSGPLHLATALGVPVVGFYGPTNPDSQGPWGEGNTVVRDESLDCLCCNRVKCPDLRCMTGISPGRALAAVEARFPAGAAG